MPTVCQSITLSVSYPYSFARFQYAFCMRSCIHIRADNGSRRGPEEERRKNRQYSERTSPRTPVRGENPGAVRKSSGNIAEILDAPVPDTGSAPERRNRRRCRSGALIRRHSLPLREHRHVRQIGVTPWCSSRSPMSGLRPARDPVPDSLRLGERGSPSGGIVPPV